MAPGRSFMAEHASIEKTTKFLKKERNKEDNFQDWVTTSLRIRHMILLNELGQEKLSTNTEFVSTYSY